MYKRLLTLTLFVALLPFMLNAQVAKQRAIPAKKAKAVTGEEVQLSKMVDKYAPVLDKTVTADLVGYSYYDYLTNGAPGDHIIRFNDGTMMIGVMAAIEGGTYPSRGSYYSYYNGTKWTDTAGTWRRVEGARKGYGTLAALGKNAIIVSHAGVAFTINTADDPAVPNWTTTNIPGTSAWTWAAVAADDMGGTAQNVYVTAGESNALPVPFVRSTDAGTTWSDVVELVDTSSFGWQNGYVGNGANDYQIAARNGKVAILNFPSAGNVTLWVSEDQGQTFTSKTLYDIALVDTALDAVPFDTSFFPAKHYKALGYVYPDGTGDVHIDANGVVHCAWGSYELYYYINRDDQGNPIRDAQGKLQRTFTYTDWAPNTGIYYWRSDWGTDRGPTQAVKPGNFQFLSDASLMDESGDAPVSKNVAMDQAMIGQPCIGSRADGTVYMSFQGFKGGDIQTYTTSTGPVQAAYGHAYIVKTVDNGLSFTTPEDVFPEITKEDVTFPSIADNVTDSVHVLFLNDKDAGNNLQWGGTSGPHPLNRALFMYKGVNAITVDVNDKAVASKSYKLDQNYPNPFNPSTKINFSLAERSVVSLKIYDMLGREVAVLVNGEMPAGSHTATFNASNLAAGMYVYTLKTNNFTSTKKMMLIK